MSVRDFKVLAFDVVGTLIDFESGVLRAVPRPIDAGGMPTMRSRPTRP